MEVITNVIGLTAEKAKEIINSNLEVINEKLQEFALVYEDDTFIEIKPLEEVEDYIADCKKEDPDNEFSFEKFEINENSFVTVFSIAVGGHAGNYYTTLDLYIGKNGFKASNPEVYIKHRHHNAFLIDAWNEDDFYFESGEDDNFENQQDVISSAMVGALSYGYYKII